MQKAQGPGLCKLPKPPAPGKNAGVGSHSLLQGILTQTPSLMLSTSALRPGIGPSCPLSPGLGFLSTVGSLLPLPKTGLPSTSLSANISERLPSREAPVLVLSSRKLLHHLLAPHHLLPPSTSPGKPFCPSLDLNGSVQVFFPLSICRAVIPNL